MTRALTVDQAARLGFRLFWLLVETDQKTSVRRKTWVLHNGVQVLRITQSGKILTNSYQEIPSETHHG